MSQTPDLEILRDQVKVLIEEDELQQHLKLRSADDGFRILDPRIT